MKYSRSFKYRFCNCWRAFIQCRGWFLAELWYYYVRLGNLQKINFLGVFNKSRFFHSPRNLQAHLIFLIRTKMYNQHFMLANSPLFSGRWVPLLSSQIRVFVFLRRCLRDWRLHFPGRPTAGWGWLLDLPLPRLEFFLWYYLQFCFKYW